MRTALYNEYLKFMHCVSSSDLFFFDTENMDIDFTDFVTYLYGKGLDILAVCQVLILGLMIAVAYLFLVLTENGTSRLSQ